MRFESVPNGPWRDAGPGVSWRSARVRVLDVTPRVERASPPPATLDWVVVRLDVARVSVTVERSIDDAIATHFERTRDALLVVNGGFFEPDHAPSGYVRSRGVDLAPVGPRGGSGVLTFARDGASVLPVDVRDAGSFRVRAGDESAVQCGPRVVEEGGIAGIHRHDGRYAARTVACVRDGGRTVDVIAVWSVEDARRGPELHDLATMLVGPSPVGDAQGCERALNLDGGPSTGLYVRDTTGATATWHEPVGPTPWALVVRPRTRAEGL